MNFNEFLVDKLEDLRLELVAEHARELLKTERKLAQLQGELRSLRNPSSKESDFSTRQSNSRQSNYEREGARSPDVKLDRKSVETSSTERERPSRVSAADLRASQHNASDAPQGKGYSINRWLSLASTVRSPRLSSGSLRGSTVSHRASTRSSPNRVSEVNRRSRRSIWSNDDADDAADQRRTSSRSAAVLHTKSNGSSHSIDDGPELKRSVSLKSHKKKSILKEARKNARARAQVARIVPKYVRQSTSEKFVKERGGSWKQWTDCDLPVDDILPAARTEPAHALLDSPDQLQLPYQYYSEHSAASEHREAHGRRMRPAAFGDHDDMCDAGGGRISHDGMNLSSRTWYIPPNPPAASSAATSLVPMPHLPPSVHDVHRTLHELHQPRCECGNIFTPDAKFCRACGKQRSQDQVCSCGTVFQFDSNFCNRCGQKRPRAGCPNSHGCHESKDREDKHGERSRAEGQTTSRSRCGSKDLTHSKASIESAALCVVEASKNTRRPLSARPTITKPQQHQQHQPHSPHSPHSSQGQRCQEHVAIPGTLPITQDDVSNICEDLWSRLSQEQADSICDDKKVASKPNAIANGQGAGHEAHPSDTLQADRPEDPVSKELSELQVSQAAHSSEASQLRIKALRFNANPVGSPADPGELPVPTGEGDEIHSGSMSYSPAGPADLDSLSSDSASLVMLAAADAEDETDDKNGTADEEEEEENELPFQLLQAWEQQMWRKSMRVKRDQTGDAMEEDEDYENIVIVKHALEHEGSFVSRIHCLRQIMIQPSSKKHLMWEALGLLCIGHDVVVVPMDVFDPPESQAGRVVQWILRFFWTLDLLLSFLTGYLHESGTLEMRPLYVARRYLRTWFPLDLLCVGFDWASYVMTTVGKYGTMLRGMRILRAVRLLRLVKAAQIERIIAEHIRSDQVILVGFITKMIVSLLVVAHIIACLWYAVGIRIGQRAVGWVRTHDMLTAQVSDRYTWSLHWALGQFTGENVYEPKHMTMEERAFAVFALLLTFLIASMFVSTVTTSVTKLQLSTSKQTSQMAALRRYLCDQEISTSLAVRVQRNAQHLLHERKRNMPEQSIELLGMISEPLRAELHFEVYSRTIRSHPFFDCYCDVNLAGVRKVSHTAISVWHASRGDIIFNDLETPAQPRMFFCQNGALQYRRVDEKPEVLRASKWAAEAVLWTHWMHVGTLRGLTNTSLLVIEAEKFHRIVNPFPTNHAYIYAEKYVSLLNQVPEEDLTDIDTVHTDQLLRTVFPERFAQESQAWSSEHMATSSMFVGNSNRDSG